LDLIAANHHPADEEQKQQQQDDAGCCCPRHDPAGGNDTRRRRHLAKRLTVEEKPKQKARQRRWSCSCPTAPAMIVLSPASAAPVTLVMDLDLLSGFQPKHHPSGRQICQPGPTRFARY
jgi:hypothetical protein